MRYREASVILAAALIMHACTMAREPAKAPDNWIYEGWSCAPDPAAALREESPAAGCRPEQKQEWLYREKGLYRCCSLDVETMKCAQKEEKQTWNECLCLGYLRYPGGRKALEEILRNLQAYNYDFSRLLSRSII